ncbi:hypothetical protein OAM78_04075 [Alphaproteobacteria bacterium]|nr:hypothetical protein [Alphaproteobacteria bacterium]
MVALILFYGLFHAVIFGNFLETHSCHGLGVLSPQDYIKFCDIKAMSFGLDVWLFFSMGAFFTYFICRCVKIDYGVRPTLEWSFSPKHLLPICFLTGFAFLLFKIGFMTPGLFNVLSTFILPLFLVALGVSTAFEYGILVATLVIFTFVTNGKLPLLLLGFRLCLEMFSRVKVKNLLILFPVLVAFLLGSVFVFAKAREFREATTIQTPDIDRRANAVASLNFILKPFWRLTLIEPTIAAHSAIENGIVQTGTYPWTAQKIANKNAVYKQFRGYALGAPALFAIFLGQKLGGLICGFLVTVFVCLFSIATKRLMNTITAKIFGGSLGVYLILDFGKATFVLFLSIICLLAYSAFCRFFGKIPNMFKKSRAK